MASVPEIGISTATQLPQGPAVPTQRQPQTNGTHTFGTQTNGHSKKKKGGKKDASKAYNHVFAIHKNSKVSPFDSDAPELSFFGFKNLMALMLIVSNLRLVIENFRKYGVLICFSCNGWSNQDLYYGSIVYFSVPFHLFIAYIIELVAAQQAKSTLSRLRKQHTNGSNSPVHRASQESFQLAWYMIGAAHFVNISLNLVISTFVVYNKIFHPAIGVAVELHAVIVWLKVCSYALTNRDLRHSLLNPEINEALPELYATCPYPQNITLGNLCYFWWAPTLIYQPVYPRTPRIRRSFVLKRAAEGISLCIVVWFTVMQYASPLLRNSVDKMHTLDIVSIAERVLKLSTISLFCWLCGFYALFHSFLNFLAEILRFADREFYSDWWNVSSVRVYWTSWNKPVYHFMRRHMYAPMIGRGWHPAFAQFVVFIFSGILHELLIGIPTHNFSGIAFSAMLSQVPFIIATDIFKDSPRYGMRVLGNLLFWFFFCITGQPIAAIVYFYQWQRQYGSLSGTNGLGQ